MGNDVDMCLDALRAAESMARGGVIVYPTDTVWGLGCDAANPEAVARIFAIKRRNEAKALITLVDSPEMLHNHVAVIPEAVWQQMSDSDRPLTIVYPNPSGLATNLLAPDGSAAIRLTSDPFCRAMIARLGKPVVSTSANLSGDPAPAFFSEISPEITEAADYVAEWRRDETGNEHAPSRIVKLNHDGSITILRP